MGVGKNDFLKVLVAQLRNQDPLKPMEDREFIGQMAQLNTVEQLLAVTAQLSGLLALQEVAQASALIGKTVEAGPPGTGPVRGVVQEVRIEGGEPVLILGDEAVWLTDVRGISA
jgi:flagellar basal-body rod modification protein FlgD